MTQGPPSHAASGQRRLNSRQIEVFRAVMIAGSLSAAADQLRVAQPSLSRMMRRMEDLVGFLLFDRVKGRLLPTDEARQLFHSIEHIQAQLASLDDVIDQIGRGGSSLFRFGASPSLARQLVPTALARFHHGFPLVRIHFDVITLSGIVDYLALGVGECFLSMTAINHPLVDTRPLAPGRLVCLLPPDHPLATHSTIDPRDLIGQPLIMCEAGTPHSRLVHDLFEEMDAAPTVAVVARFAELAIGLTGAGLGLAVVDEFTAMDAASARVAVRPLSGPPRFHVHLSRSRNKESSRFAIAFREALSSVMSGSA